MGIRNSAKGIIISEDKILVTKNRDSEGVYYLFPGGGQEWGETLHHTLIRECLEEVGKEVDVKELLHIREYIGKNHEHAAFDSAVHQVEFYFVCHALNECGDQAPTQPDQNQVGMEWLPIEALLEYRIYPKSLRKSIIEYHNDKKSFVYLGDIN
ncbi:NUDIX domain-containing protein [Shouchella hunanensis]|uniref:NUDIX domain-containing protein n=1 Tax=Shouchella hunanensis TaxID=766894 RepID=A0ABY7W6G7_9BACI|nr:NUDIX domain-containing protein [Shouchella hunanensis]WDF02325.1 NUDIX domain-containing protein [Shouchella hunanensis]